MVFGPKEIEDVLKGENGMLKTSCKDKVWIDLTTSSPTLMRSLAKEFEDAGGYAVDAPVTGSLDSAIRGDMIMSFRARRRPAHPAPLDSAVLAYRRA